MSDIYDYVYAHTMHQQQEKEEKYTYCTTMEESNSEGEINAADFSPFDLQMFVDSLEAIARLEQIKCEKKQKRKVKKHSKKRQVTCLDSSTCSSLHDDDGSSFSGIYSSSEYLYNETYSGLPAADQCTALYSNLSTHCSNSSSDSEDSGIFVNSSSSESHLYENFETFSSLSSSANEASDSDTYKKRKSLKSRLLALIMKKQSKKSQISSIKIDEQLEESKIYDHVIDNVIQQQLSKKSKKSKKFSTGSKSQPKILAKAMRLLTL